MIANFGCHVYAFAQSCVKLEGILLRIRRRELILENSKHDCKSKYVFYFASWMHSACMGNTGAFLIHDLICIDAFKHLLNIYLQFIDNQTIFFKASLSNAILKKFSLVGQKPKWAHCYFRHIKVDEFAV